MTTCITLLILGGAYLWLGVRIGRRLHRRSFILRRLGEIDRW